ncbi:MAG TPA: hypothetical protein ENI20_09745 [Bacteroides sp.]|nr:hypothetical protein [Bacteroides sp.]
MAAVDDGRFDVFLMTYNFVNREKAERVLRACAEKNVRTTIMTSNPMITFKAIEGAIQSMEETDKRVDDTLMDWHSRLVEETTLAKNFFGKYGYKDEDEEMLKASTT